MLARIAVLGVLAALAAPAVARGGTVIGKVAELSAPVMSFRNDEGVWRDATPKGLEDISDTCDVQTTGDGQALFLWTDPRFRKNTRLQLQRASKLLIRRYEEAAIQLKLTEGAFQFAGTQPVVATTEHHKAWTSGTAFIMRYDRPSDCTEVLGIENVAQVQSDFLPAAIESLGPKDLVVVCGRQRPQKRRLTDEEYEEYLRPYELPGNGAATSQTVNDPQLVGKEVPNPDRAPGPPPSDPPRDETGERWPDFDESLPAVGAVDLGIDF